MGAQQILYSERKEIQLSHRKFAWIDAMFGFIEEKTFTPSLLTT